MPDCINSYPIGPFEWDVFSAGRIDYANTTFNNKCFHTFGYREWNYTYGYPIYQQINPPPAAGHKR